jgi:glycosyltransferase involved in cell wall biosynthesis
MRIVFFTDTFIPKVDGIVTTLCQTVRQLRALGHEVLIVAPAGGFGEFEQSRIVGMKGRPFAFYPQLTLALPHASLRKSIAEFQPDLLHVADPALLGIAGLYYGGGDHGGALHLPLVVSYHTDLPKYLRYYGLGFLESSIWPILRTRHRRATMNLCTSTAIVDELRSHGIGNLALWPGGVDADRFNPGQRSQAMRERLSGGHLEDPLLLYVGRLSAEKEIERLRPMLEALPNARLALVGDGPHRGELERCFAGMPVTMAGFLHGDELAAAFASSDIFVMPSRTETLGLVVLEAMASGLPVVAARAGGIPEMIEDGASGFLFDRENEAIAAIDKLLHAPDLRTGMGIKAREQACRRSWKAATELLVEHYKEACTQQCVTSNGSGNGNGAGHQGIGSKARSALGRTALFAARRLLP